MNSMYEKVIIIKGKDKGPTSMILAGVHGNEICGVKALEKLIPCLNINAGKLIIAFGNPKAIRLNVRFTEANLNRMFKKNSQLTGKEKSSYEYKRAQYLKKYLNQVDCLLDIHASTTPNSQSFIICEPNARTIAKYLPTRVIVSGFDDVEPGGTDYYMNKAGKIGICLECGYLRSSRSKIIAEKGILAFLNARGNLNTSKAIRKQSHIQMYEKYYTKTDNFKLSKKFSDFEKLDAGQIIGFDGKNLIKAPKSSIILFAQNVNKIGGEAFLLGK